MGLQWNVPFLSPSHSSPDLARSDSQLQADSLASLLRSSSRKDPCRRLYRKAALLPDSSTKNTATPTTAAAVAAAAPPPPPAASATGRSSSLRGQETGAAHITSTIPEDPAEEDMTYPPSAPYRRDAEARATRSASNINGPSSGASGGPVKNGMPLHDQPNGRYVDYNDISDDDDDLRSPPPPVGNPHTAQDAVNLQRQTQQRLGSSAATQPPPEHWVPAASHGSPRGGPHPVPSGGVRVAPGSGPGPVRSRPPSYSGGRPDELALAGAGSGGAPPPQSNSSRPPQRSGQPGGGAHKRRNSRSPPDRRSGQSQQQQQQQQQQQPPHGGPPPAMLNNNNNNQIQRLPTPSVAASVLQPLEQKVSEYAGLMRDAEDQVDRLDDEIRALQERRAAAESRYMEAKARHDEYKSQYSDVERALRGELPPLTPMLPPLQSQPGSIGVMSGGGGRPGAPSQQQRGGGSMASIHDQYHYEHGPPPDGMNRPRQSGQYGGSRPMSSSSAGGSIRDGFGSSGKKGKGKFRFSLFG